MHKALLLAILTLLTCYSAEAQTCFLIPGQQIGYTTNSSAICRADGTKTIDFYGVFWPDADQNQFFQNILPPVAGGLLYGKTAQASGTQWYSGSCYSAYLACRNQHAPPWPDNTCHQMHPWLVFDRVTLAWLGEADSAGGPILPKTDPNEVFVCPTPVPTPPPTLAVTLTASPVPSATRSPAPGTPTIVPTQPPCNPPFCVSTPTPSGPTPTLTPDLKPTRTVSPVPPVTNVPTAPCLCATPTPTPCPCPALSPSGKTTSPPTSGSGGCRGGGTPALLVPLLLLAARRRVQ